MPASLSSRTSDAAANAAEARTPLSPSCLTTSIRLTAAARSSSIIRGAPGLEGLRQVAPQCQSRLVSHGGFAIVERSDQGGCHCQEIDGLGASQLRYGIPPLIRIPGLSLSDPRRGRGRARVPQFPRMHPEPTQRAHAEDYDGEPAQDGQQAVPFHARDFPQCRRFTPRRTFSRA